MQEYNIDYKALAKELKNEAELKLILALTPDEKDKEVLKKALKIFITHGVDVDVAMAIMVDLIENENKKEN